MSEFDTSDAPKRPTLKQAIAKDLDEKEAWFAQCRELLRGKDRIIDHERHRCEMDKKDLRDHITMQDTYIDWLTARLHEALNAP